MDLEYGQRYEDFRNEVRGFLDEHKPKKPIAGLSSGEGRKTLIDWLSLQIEHGYWARTIPKEYGGYGASPDLLETVIMDEEFNRVGVVRGLPAQGPSMLVPTLLEHGTEEQKKRWIGPTMRAEVMWCQGYSEPGSGSDLASLQTSGREDGDDFLINGQKIWTSSADKSEMIFVLVRTEPDASKHAGISYLLAPMDTPGIEVQQLRTMSGNLGENSFNQVFFTDVRVPQSNIVGKRGEGWKIANTTLKHERNSLNSNGEGSLVRLMKLMNQETVNGVSAMANPVFRDRLMKLQGRVLSMKHHGMRMLTCSLQGESPGVAGLIIKLQNCQLNFDMASLAIDVMGELGVLYDHSKYERARGYWQSHSIFSLGLIIGGGTAQIQKNIISERGLGMPREPKPAKA
ncbi:MAG: acyl-CoA dehydrogenase family protein [Deltaproteobacteria bacterium]|nr:acyl-CoA dehydrogenase family protein [Deltaproteobacteria bacterium]